MLPAAVCLAGLLAGCPDNKAADAAATGTPESASASAAPPAAASAEATTTAAAVVPTASAAPTADATAAAATASAAGSAKAAAGAPSGTAAAGEKTFDCGAKGQKACPMQGWMKSVMGAAAQSGDGQKLAAALATVASKPVPGYGQWVAISNDGVAKAKAGDIEGAKKTCEKCHALYKDKYKKTMRDRPW
jgi:hypothetical protein